MRRITAGLFVALMTFASIPAALACGGFFCQNFPIDQAGEKIVFQMEDDTVKAVIQIQFQGDAEDFSWILPLPSAPYAEDGMSIGSEELFVQLMNRTAPTFTVNWTGVNDCQPWWGNEDDFLAEADGGSEGGGGGNGVQVLQIKDVGPYTAAVVKSDNPDALSAWLTENDYDQPPESGALIAHYVALDTVFLALKLQQDKGAGDIAPIVVEFDEPTGPCIPLILTAIAATEDMPVYAWMLDDSRVVPKNFFNVGINWGKINWFDGGSNYIDVVTAAVSEAAGHGFVTEYAGPSDLMKEAVYWEGRFDQVENLAAYTHPRDFYNAFISSGLPSNTQTLAILQKYIPVPAEYEGEAMNFYNEIAWNSQWDEYLDNLDFDPVAATAEIQEVIVEPILDAQAMLDAKPYMTRIFTTMSPDDMDRDPIFVNAPSLGDVSKDHVADATGVCGANAEGSKVISEVKLTLANGMVVDYEGEFPVWGGNPDTSAGTADGTPVEDLASAGEISIINDDGELEVVSPDMIDYVDDQLGILGFDGTPDMEDPEGEDETPVVPDPEEETGETPENTVADTPGSIDGTPETQDATADPVAEPTVEDGGCSSTTPSNGLWLLALAGVLFLARRREAGHMA